MLQMMACGDLHATKPDVYMEQSCQQLAQAAHLRIQSRLVLLCWESYQGNIAPP